MEIFFSYFFKPTRFTNHPTHHPKLHIGRKKRSPKHHQPPNHHQQLKKQPSKHHKPFKKQPPKLQPTIKPPLTTQKTTTIKQKSRLESEEKSPQTRIRNQKKKKKSQDTNNIGVATKNPRLSLDPRAVREGREDGSVPSVSGWAMVSG